MVRGHQSSDALFIERKNIEEAHESLVEWVNDHHWWDWPISKEDNKKALAVDHDHATGKIRDLLCNNCNVVVGFLNEQVDLCDKIKDYISKHKE